MRLCVHFKIVGSMNVKNQILEEVSSPDEGTTQKLLSN